MKTEDKSFLAFLRQVYGSVEGHIFLLSLVIWVPSLYLDSLYAPSDFVRNGTFNGWWIVITTFLIWIHGIIYLMWREIANEAT